MLSGTRRKATVRLICKALNGLHNNVLLGQIMISNTKSKRVNENIKTHANFHVSFSFGFHYNVLLELITISNIRSERVNENITTLRTCLP